MGIKNRKKNMRSHHINEPIGYDEINNSNEETTSVLASEVQEKFELQYLGETLNEHKHQEPKKRKYPKTEEQQRLARLEEEKYDQLLSSVQAQNLIKTVDQFSHDEQKKKSVHQTTTEYNDNHTKINTSESENQGSYRSHEHFILNREIQNHRLQNYENHNEQKQKEDISDISIQNNVVQNKNNSEADVQQKNSVHELTSDTSKPFLFSKLQRKKEKIKLKKEQRHQKKLEKLKEEARIASEQFKKENLKRVGDYQNSQNETENQNQSEKQRLEDEVYVDSIEKVNTSVFQHGDIKSYIEGQCEIMKEATSHIDQAMDEYSDVTEYFTDIQKIEQSPEKMQKKIQILANRVNELCVDRRISKSSEYRLSTSAYNRMEQLQDEVPRGFQYMKKQESYHETVKRDMRILEGEQLGLRLEARILANRQLKIKNFSIAAIVGLVLAFVVFMAALGLIETDDYAPYYILIILLGSIISVGLFALQKYTERQVLLTEIKLNKTTGLLNKTKIKYVNAANTLDYEYSKYRVKSSYDLEKKYQAYIEMKEDQKKVLSMTSALNDAQQDLEAVLNQLKLYDTHIWLGQVKALCDPKDMVEVRHDLTIQRQKLRKLIEYNEKRIEEAKQNIKYITQKHPEFTQTVLEIIQQYEQKNNN